MRKIYSLLTLLFIGTPGVIAITVDAEAANSGGAEGTANYDQTLRRLEAYRGLEDCVQKSAPAAYFQDAAKKLYLKSQLHSKAEALSAERARAQAMANLSESEQKNLNDISSRATAMMFRGRAGLAGTLSYMAQNARTVENLKQSYLNRPERIQARADIQRIDRELQNLAVQADETLELTDYEAKRKVLIGSVTNYAQNSELGANGIGRLPRFEMAIATVTACPTFSDGPQINPQTLMATLATRLEPAALYVLAEARNHSQTSKEYGDAISSVVNSQTLRLNEHLTQPINLARSFQTTLVNKENETARAARAAEAEQAKVLEARARALDRSPLIAGGPSTANIRQTIITARGNFGMGRDLGDGRTLAFMNVYGSEIKREAIDVQNAKCINVSSKSFKCSYVSVRTVGRGQDGSISSEFTSIFLGIAKSARGDLSFSENRVDLFNIRDGEWTSPGYVQYLREERARMDEIERNKPKQICKTEMKEGYLWDYPVEACK